MKPTSQVALFGSSSAIINPLKGIAEKFEELFKKRAYFHKYKEVGMDEMEFEMAKNNLDDLISEY